MANGRNINFTLLDFNNPNRKLKGDSPEDPAQNPLPGACPMTMYVTDGEVVKTQDICVSDLREQNLFTTSGSSAQVYFAFRDVTEHRYHFLIKYEGNYESSVLIIISSVSFLTSDNIIR